MVIAVNENPCFSQGWKNSIPADFTFTIYTQIAIFLPFEKGETGDLRWMKNVYIWPSRAYISCLDAFIEGNSSLLGMAYTFHLDIKRQSVSIWLQDSKWIIKNFPIWKTVISHIIS